VQTELIDPASGAVFDQVPRYTAREVALVVETANRAFEQGVWRKAPVRERRDVLRRIADLIRRDSDRLAALESRNVGKPITAARGEVAAAAATFDYYAGAVDKFHGQTIPGQARGTLLTFHEPIGVCAAIIPWNFPLLILGWKLAPALAMGNSVVAKPAEVTPLTALALADLCIEAGLPEGVFSVVTGRGSEIGEALVSHPFLGKVAFTGSSEVGTAIMQQAAPGIKRVSLELGGKSANLVFEDADLDVCVESSIWSVYDNSGQDCCARSRMLIERSVYDEFLRRFTARAESIKVGDPSAESTEMGPLITSSQRDRVEGYLELAVSEGASIESGGNRIGNAGFYLAPTVVTGADPGTRVMQEEIFGPVVAMLPFQGEEEAIRLANASIFGLSGSIWTRDIGRALRVARGVETGMLSINSSSSVHIEAPFGGVKQSGFGREQGMAALDQYSEYKTVFIAEQ
jgi:betaine-aldehyde dehydrogenase